MTTAERTGLALREPLPWHDLIQVVRTAEETGYEAVFVPEIAAREAFATLAGFAGATSRIRLGAGVVVLGSRSPVTTAMAAATVQDLSGGRAILGIGAGNLARERGRSPIDAVRDYIEAVRAALAGGIAFDPRGGLPPVWLGALGDRMIHLGGQIADGLILNWCTPERVAHARRLVSEGAERAGRDPGSITIAVYVRACLGVEEPIALEALRGMTGRYAVIPQYLRQLALMGLGEEGALAAKAHRAGLPGEVPESLVRSLSVSGGRSEARARFEAYREAGADLVVCYPVPVLDPFSSLLGTVLAAAPMVDGMA
jgi:5,10-methylenetetrahydromethanopterin reductase